MDEGDDKKTIDLEFPFKNYVLALPGWYPTFLDPLPGDFNQRHIKAASIYTPQIVLYIGKDQSGTIKRTQVTINRLTERILEYIIIYPKKSIKVLDAVHSNLRFLILLFKYSKIIRNTFGKPSLLHSYIVMRGGLAGWLLKMKWRVPFILSENWTIYYPADPGYLPTRNVFFQWIVARVFRSVKRFLPVTNNLKQRAAELLQVVPATVVPNVVETDVFNYSDPAPTEELFKFIHVSTMIYQKNPEGLLRTFKKFKERVPGAILQMVGPHPDKVFEYAETLGLTKEGVEFTGPVSYLRVSELLKSSNALVLFSRYENLPCVILEAFCCGLPVISTTVGGISEVIDVENGILIDSENEGQLLDALISIYNNYQTYNRSSISRNAINKFSYAAIGEKIDEVYREITGLTL